MTAEDADDILDRWKDRIHPIYAEERERVQDVVEQLREQGRTPAGMKAALERTVARMADTEITYIDVADRYDVGVSEVTDWTRRLRRIGDFEPDFNRKQMVQEEDLPDRLDALLSVRPYTGDELREELYTSVDITGYLSDVDTVQEMTRDLSTGSDVTVWYLEDDESTAEIKLQYVQARASLQEDRFNFRGFLREYGERLQEGGRVTDRERWMEQYGAIENRVKEVREASAQHFGVFERGFPAVKDYLISYDRCTPYFTATDVTGYLEAHTVATVDSPNNIGRTLKVLSDRTELLEEFGGSPRKYDASSTAEEDLYVVDAALTTIGEFTERYR